MPKKRSEGVRRLSYLAGGLGVLFLSFVFFVASLDATGEFKWGRFASALAISFAVPFAFVRALGWVVQGFLKDRH